MRKVDPFKSLTRRQHTSRPISEKERTERTIHFICGRLNMNTTVWYCHNICKHCNNLNITQQHNGEQQSN